MAASARVAYYGEDRLFAPDIEGARRASCSTAIWADSCRAHVGESRTSSHHASPLRPNRTAWRGVGVDAEEGPLGLRWHQTVRRIDASTPPANTVALAGFACDAGARAQPRANRRTGGPAATRKMPARILRPRTRRPWWSASTRAT
ncbi:hypothetical protein ACU4HD_46320 [Cupriavidus basilensis]